MLGGEGGFDEFVNGPELEQGFSDPVIVDRFIERLEARPAEPVFAFLRLGSPHWPYLCAEAFHEAGPEHGPELHAFNRGAQGVAIGRRGGLALADPSAYRQLMYTKHPEPVLEHLRLHYDECVRQSDAEIGRALEALRRLGRYESSLVVVTSDHGESFGEHGYHTHGPQVDDPVMRVPLVMRFPERLASSLRQTRVSQLLRTVDLLPTVADALRLEAPVGIDGVSLLPAIREDRDLELLAYGESGRSFVGVDPVRRLPGVAGKLRMLRSPRWKLVHTPNRSGGRDRLYDLESPEGETRDVASLHPEVVEKLRRELDGIMARDRRALAHGEPRLDESEKERLRQLGYL